MATGPSRPALPPPAAPKPTSRLIRDKTEAAKEEQRKEAKRRKGYAKTIATRGGLGEARTEKQKALGV
jgi:hypothetical protein